VKTPALVEAESREKSRGDYRGGRPEKSKRELRKVARIH
jgi:hypothetical protein